MTLQRKQGEMGLDKTNLSGKDLKFIPLAMKSGMCMCKDNMSRRKKEKWKKRKKENRKKNNKFKEKWKKEKRK